MSRTHEPPPPPLGHAPVHAVQVLSGAPAVSRRVRGRALGWGEMPCVGTGVHVRSLAAGLVAHGLRVTVCAPRGAESTYGFGAAGAELAGPEFAGPELAGPGLAGPGLAGPERAAPGLSVPGCPGPGFTAPERAEAEHGLPGAQPLGEQAWFAPARADAETVLTLRRACADADIVHAHGLHAGLLAALALGGRRRRVPLVVTWHARERADGAQRRLVRLLERRVARAASVVLGATSDLVDLARRRGARDARLAPVAPPFPGPHSGTYEQLAADPDAAAKVRAEVGAVDRPLLLAVGRLDPLQDYGTALTAARAWRGLEPPPLLAIAGEGPRRGMLQARIDAEALPVRLLGCRDDAFDLLAVADIALLPACSEARSLLAQEALRAGVPLVASAVGGLPELVGDAGLLVPHADADALAAAVTGLLGDPGRRASLATAGRARAACLPTEDDTVAHVLSVYDELAQRQRQGPSGTAG